MSSNSDLQDNAKYRQGKRPEQTKFSLGMVYITLIALVFMFIIYASIKALNHLL